MVVNVSVTWMDGKKAEYLAHWYQVRNKSWFTHRKSLLDEYSDGKLLEMETVGKGTVYVVLANMRHFTVKHVEEVKPKNAREAKSNDERKLQENERGRA